MFIRRMKLRPNLVVILLVLLWSASAVTPVKVFAKRISSSFQPIPGGHGCVNAAQDPRLDPSGWCAHCNDGSATKVNMSPTCTSTRTGLGEFRRHIWCTTRGLLGSSGG